MSSAGIAQARVEERSAISAYVRARAAADAGFLDQASQSYAAALAADPDNELVASQALSHAVTAGDWPLALRAAHMLDERDLLLPDARFLLVAESFRAGDWDQAERQIDLVERERLFAFAVPVLRAWLAVGSREGDPLSFLPQPNATGAASIYAAEHRPLLMIARGRGQVNEAARALAQLGGARGLRLRIAAAATLADRGRRDDALALLQGDEAPLVAARELVGRGRPIPGAMATAPAGLAEFLVKLALDLHGQDLTSIASTFARLATWLAPESSETWIVAAELLAQEDQPAAAVALLDNVRADDPFAVTVRDQRIRLLVDRGDVDQALAQAQAAATAPSATAADHVRLGEVLSGLDRSADAAEAFKQALAARPDEGNVYPEWSLWLMRGGALDQAGDWPQAKAALERAYSLAPDQPLVLNYLGYAQLERRENMEAAERMIREAHRLDPDNPAITDSLGWALFLKGERAEAIPLLEEAAQGAPADVEINEHLGDAYYAAGRRLDARFAWTAARVYAEGEDAERLNAKIETGLTPQVAVR